MHYRHEIIDRDPPATELDDCLPVDLTGSGRDDVIIGGKTPPIVWSIEDGWKRHRLAEIPIPTNSFSRPGGVLMDLTGKGRLVAGQPGDGTRPSWFEQPEDPGTLWTPRVITDRYGKDHDQAVGDGRRDVVRMSYHPEHRVDAQMKTS